MSASTRKLTSDIADDLAERPDTVYTKFFAQPYLIFKSQITELASIPNVLVVILMRIAIMFVESSMSSRNIVNYYETRFGIPTSALGFMSTATSGKLLFPSITPAFKY